MFFSSNVFKSSDLARYVWGCTLLSKSIGMRGTFKYHSSQREHKRTEAEFLTESFDPDTSLPASNGHLEVFSQESTEGTVVSSV